MEKIVDIKGTCHCTWVHGSEKETKMAGKIRNIVSWLCKVMRWLTFF